MNQFWGYEFISTYGGRSTKKKRSGVKVGNAIVFVGGPLSSGSLTPHRLESFIVEHFVLFRKNTY